MLLIYSKLYLPLVEQKTAEVQFVKKMRGTTEALFQYPETDEFDTVPFSYITEYLDAPKVNSRHHLVFSNVKHPVFR